MHHILDSVERLVQCVSVCLSVTEVNDEPRADVTSSTAIKRSSVSNGGLSLTARLRAHPPPPPPPPPPVSGPAAGSAGLGVTSSYCQYHCFATVGRRHHDKLATSGGGQRHQQQQQQPAKHEQRLTTNSACSSLV